MLLEGRSLGRRSVSAAAGGCGECELGPGDCIGPRGRDWWVIPADRRCWRTTAVGGGSLYGGGSPLFRVWRSGPSAVRVSEDGWVACSIHGGGWRGRRGGRL
ncbi:ATP synthase epsilon chain [Striga asiatica]|uniref:ATP synthase epsilon chain n=1 Tax=Striga asiatica TaxID=4170 RepID=A0A5A7RIR2_STRAF|nr:ATP synthase epsilon chain [Striga asiatica]